MERRASRPSTTPPFNGTPRTGSVVWAATTPPRWAAIPAAVIITFIPFSSALFENSATSSGFLCADITFVTNDTPK